MSDNTAWSGADPVPHAERDESAGSDAADHDRSQEDTGGADRAYGPDEEQLVAERLRALGYIE